MSAPVSELKWEKSYSTRESANSSFGSYYVESASGGGFRWGYCFDEYYDEDNFSCDSIDEGKAAAQKDWNDRTSDILDGAFSPVVAELLAVIRENWQGQYWRAVNHDMAERVNTILAKHGGAQ